jgi:ubiquinone/menaquinone biosynthesis C-methylase UbiE
MAAEVEELLACPRCGERVATNPVYHCEGCALEFPSLDGVPCLFADPSATLGEWRQRLHLLIATLRRDAAALDNTLQSAEVLPTTEKRLSHLRAAKEDHARRLQKILSPLDLTRLEANYDTLIALKTRLPSDQGLTTYYNNIHRDWDWGEEENAASLKLVLRALGDEGPGETSLVLGAGAGRLAYDLHQASGSGLTLAADFNPLLALLARRIANGETLELHEFPIAPKSLEDSAVLRTLRAPAPVRDGMHFILADALHPPFREASFSTIITPWLVDILPGDFSTLCRRVNRLLAPGGRWVIFGSLAFHHSDPVLCYSPEECIDAIKDAGFSDPSVEESVIPYMCSPASRHARRECVVIVCARKERDADAPTPYQALPEWLLQSDEPVPLLQSFQTQAVSTRIYAYIMSLIDGQRSAADIARVVSEQGLMSEEEAGPTIRTFLAKMYTDSGRQSGF